MRNAVSVILSSRTMIVLCPVRAVYVRPQEPARKVKLVRERDKARATIRHNDIAERVAWSVIAQNKLDAACADGLDSKNSAANVRIRCIANATVLAVEVADFELERTPKSDRNRWSAREGEAGAIPRNTWAKKGYRETEVECVGLVVEGRLGHSCGGRIVRCDVSATSLIYPN